MLTNLTFELRYYSIKLLLLLTRYCSFVESSSSGKPRDNVQYLVDTLEKLPLLVINTIDAAETTKGMQSYAFCLGRLTRSLTYTNLKKKFLG